MSKHKRQARWREKKSSFLKSINNILPLNLYRKITAVFLALECSLAALTSSGEELLKTWDFSSPAQVGFVASNGCKAEKRVSQEVRTPDGSSSLEVELKSIPADTVVHAIQLIFNYSGTPLKAGRCYEVTFFCKASNSGSFQMAAAYGAPPWSELAGSQTSVSISPEWKRCTMRFVAKTDIKEPLHMPRIMLAKFSAPAKLWFGPVSLQEIPTPQPFCLSNDWKIFFRLSDPTDLSRVPVDVKAKTVSLKHDSIDLGALSGGFDEKDSAWLFNEFNAPGDGMMKIGMSADWWFAAYVNGQKVYDTMALGNISHSFFPDDHVFNIPVKKGRNLLAVKVLSGSGGWRFVCGYPQNKSQDGILIIKPGNAWKPIDQRRLSVLAGSPLDFSKLTGDGVPAGAKGRVIINIKGRLAFETEPEKPIRLWGYNTWDCLQFPLRRKEELKAYAENTARQGYNSLRFQGLCLAISGGPRGAMSKTKQAEMKVFDEAVKDDAVLDPACLDNIDYFISCAKKEGIYLNIDLLNGTGYCLSKEGSEKGSCEDFKTNLLFAGTAQRKHWESAVKKLMTHVNPYTGVRYADEPAIFCVEPVNEQDLLLYDKARMGLFTPHFRNYLREKYVSVDEMRKAWKQPQIAFDNVPDIDEVILRKGDAQSEDAGMFLIKTMSNTNQWYYSVLRDSGYKGIITQWDMIMRTMEMPARAMMPAIAQHAYFDHPEGVPSKNWLPKSPASSAFGWGGASVDIVLGQSSSLNSSFFRAAAAIRFLDRPFMMTEYSHSFPSRYRHERGLFYGAYAALQGWDALYCHGVPVFNHINGTDKCPIISFESAQDPISRASEAITALAWFRRDVSEAGNSVGILLSDKALFPKHFLAAIGDDYARISMLTKIGVLYPQIKPLEPAAQVVPNFTLEPLAFSTLNVRAWYASASNKGGGQLPLLLQKLKEHGVIAKSNKTDVVKQIYQSETGEITLDGKSATLNVVTPRLEGTIIKESGAISLGELQISSCDKPATVVIASLEKNVSISNAKRLLLVFATNALNENAAFENYRMNLMIDVGKAPVLMETAKLVLSLKSLLSTEASVYALHLDGSRMAEVPSQLVSGRLMLDMDTAKLPYGAVFFEVVRN